MYSKSVKIRLVAGVLIAAFLFQNCNVYHRIPVTVDDVRNGVASPIEIVALNDKIHHFDHLSFDGDKIYGIKYSRLKVIKALIPLDRIKYLRMKKVMIRFKDGHREYYRYLLVNKSGFTGIKTKKDQEERYPIDTEQISGIHLLNPQITGLVNGVIIIGGFSLLAFIIFPFLQSKGWMPRVLFDQNS